MLFKILDGVFANLFGLKKTLKTSIKVPHKNQILEVLW